MRAARKAMWLIGAPARALVLALIRVYQASLSGWLGGQCRFSPTCSAYTAEAVHARGLVVGSALGLWRVLRCNPFGRGGLDPAPGRRTHAPYEVITQKGGAG